MQLLDLPAKGLAALVRPERCAQLVDGRGSVGVYTFNKHLLKHRFCPTCGIHPYAEGKDPKGNDMAAINIRCLEGIDLASIPVTHFDGRSR